MTITVTIGGVTMTGDSHYVDEASISHVNALGQRDTFTCRIVSVDGSYVPEVGAAVVVSDDIAARFGGSIRDVKVDQFAGAGGALMTTIQCASWEQIFDRRLVGAITFPEGTTAGDIFTALLDFVSAEGITGSVVAAGPAIASCSFDWCTVREALDTLCQLASDETDTFMWDCTPDKVVRFYKQSSFAAPIDVTDASTDVMRPIAISRSFDGYANKIFIRLPRYITEERTNSYSPSGSETSFAFEIPLAKQPTVYVDGVEQTVGIKDKDTGKQFYWQDNSADVTPDAGLSLGGTSLVIIAQGYQSTVIDAGQDNDEVTARSIAEDNSGWYMILLESSTGNTAADALAIAQAWFAKFGKVPYAVEYITDTNGIKAGMHQAINLTGFGAEIDATFIVESVTLGCNTGTYYWKVRAVSGALANGWLQKLRKIATGQSSATGSGGNAGTITPTEPSAPAAFTIGAISYNWRAKRSGGRMGIHEDPTLQLVIPVTPPTPLGTTRGGHLYAEVPDQSSSAGFRLGEELGSAGLGSAWRPIDLGKLPYVAEEQPWTVTLPADVVINGTTSIRIYVAPYSENADTPLVRAGETGATPSALVSVEPYVSAKPDSGSGATTLLVPSISATADPTVSIGGKLRRPISVTVDLTGLSTPLPENWAYQILGFINGDITGVPVLVSGYFSHEGLVEAGPDGISTPHTFGPEEPTASTSITIYAVAGVLSRRRVTSEDAQPVVFRRNNIVPGITASDTVTIGTSTGVIDPTKQMQDKLATTMAILNDLFGVAELGISEGYLAALAVSTPKIQDAAVQLAKLNDLSVSTAKVIDTAINTAKMADLAATAAKLANSSVTAAKIDNLAVGTVAIAAAAVTTAKIANLAVTTALIDNAAVTTAKVGSAQITTALIANLAVTTALINNAAIGTAQIADAAITTIKIGDAQITSAKIGAAQVTTANIADACITNAKIVDATITSAKIASLAVSQLTGWSGATITITSGVTFTNGLGASTIIEGNQIITANVISVFGVSAGTYLSTSSAAYTSAPVRLGGYILWVDSAGRLRIKAGVPASDTDGTVVGAQS